MSKRWYFGLFLLIGVLVACSQSPTPAAEQPTATQPSVAQVTDTPVVVSSPTVAVAPTLPPPPTAVPVTFTPVPTVEPTATVTPTPAPVFLLVAEDFGMERNPLTGEVVTDPTVLQRRPIAIKISNSPPEYTRPQNGLSQADLVFEHVTEGPITRFTAIFYSQTPSDVGPIRSARLIDAELPAMYDAALAYSGSSIGVSEKLFGSDFRPRILRSYEPGYYRTGEDKPWEHTLHGRPTEFWQALTANEQNVPPQFKTFMAFSSETPTGGEPASALTVNYRDWTVVDWQYEAENGRYWRTADGQPHLDGNTGAQISAANVIVVYAIHMQNMSICESQSDTTCNAFSTEIQIWGSGDAQIFRDGQTFTATWKREKRNDMFTFYDEAGNVIPLQIGNTWFQVVPYHYTDPVTITP